MTGHAHLLTPALAFVLVAGCASFDEDTTEARDASLDARDAGLIHIAPPDAHLDTGHPVDASKSSSFASCASDGGGRSSCGTTASGTESCCTSLGVEGGTFDRAYDPYGFDGGITVGPDGSAIDESDPASIETFRLDKYPVTVGRFRLFAEAVFPPDGGIGWSPAVGSGKHAYLNGGLGLSATGGGYEPGWADGDSSNIAPTTTNLQCDATLTAAATWTEYPGSYEYLPINCVNWYEAYAFCIWDGGFLPSDAELGYAMAGGAEQREYPWGSANPGTMNEYAIYGTVRPNGPAEEPVCYYPDDMFCVGVTGSIAPVGTPSMGAGRWGQVDLAGEVFEWNLDWFDQNGFINPCADCAYLTPPGGGSPTAQGRVVRGGDFESQLFDLPSSNRLYSDPANRSSTVGFRCARAPAP